MVCLCACGRVSTIVTGRASGPCGTRHRSIHATSGPSAVTAATARRFVVGRAATAAPSGAEMSFWSGKGRVEEGEEEEHAGLVGWRPSWKRRRRETMRS